VGLVLGTGSSQIFQLPGMEMNQTYETSWFSQDVKEAMENGETLLTQ